MNRLVRAPAAFAAIALLASVNAAAAAPDASVTLVKTVGTNPLECAPDGILVEPPPDGIVYYCYKMTYTGAVTASCHTLVDSVLGSVLDHIPGGRCCTNESGTNCADPATVCAHSFACPGVQYPVCAATTYPGVCCDSFMQTKCPLPHRPCEEDSQCFMSERCVTNPIVGPGQTISRVITATVPEGGIANKATWTAQTGICCDDIALNCSGLSTPPFCATDDDCGGAQTCRKEGIGLCCDPTVPGSCNKVCLSGRECAPFNDPNDPNAPFDPFTSCEVVDTVATDHAGARIGVVDTPVLSAAALALFVLMLVGIGLGRLRRESSPPS